MKRFRFFSGISRFLAKIGQDLLIFHFLLHFYYQIFGQNFGVLGFKVFSRFSPKIPMSTQGGLNYRSGRRTHFLDFILPVKISKKLILRMSSLMIFGEVMGLLQGKMLMLCLCTDLHFFGLHRATPIF